MKKISLLILLFLFVFTSISIAAGTIRWNSVEHADGYRLFISQGNPDNFDYENPDIETSELSSLLPETLIKGERYYFVLRAYNSYGESPNSNIVGYTIPLESIVIEYPGSPTISIILTPAPAE